MHYYYSFHKAFDFSLSARARRRNTDLLRFCDDDDVHLPGPDGSSPPVSLPKDRLVRTAKREEQWGLSRHMWGAPLSDPSRHLHTRASVAALGRIPYSVSEGHPGGASRCTYPFDPVNKDIHPLRPCEPMFHMSTAARSTIR